jgi:hypothetical protein
MSRRIALAGALMSAILAVAPAANAADLGGRYGPATGYDPYDDPRYADIYRHPPPPSAYPAPPAPPAYRPEPPRGYSHVPPRHDHGYGHGRCLPSEAVRSQLMSDGWTDFRGVELRNDIAVLEARRPSGDLYRLKIGRCSGSILKAHLVQPAGTAPYAHAPPHYGYGTGPYATAPYGRPGYGAGPRHYRPY